jgi:dTDP-4-dehydrorhamnose reductase
MLQLSETRNELKVVNDQFGLPTFTKDLCLAISEVIKNISANRRKVFHFSNF